MKTQQTRADLYLSPSCRVAEIENEGVLCASGIQPANTISDYVEETYQW